MKRVITLLVFALSSAALPLAGAYLAGRSIEPYLQFPARVPQPAPASLDWAAFLIYALIIVAVAGPFMRRIAGARGLQPGAPSARRPFPWWGWTGMAVTAIAWILAWTRFPWFAPLQPYTFTPLWLGYILVVNALVFRRTGRCLLVNRPACFLALFPASAAFWWYFEFLNRFAGNWYYAGVGTVSTAEYVVHASISFSTVLPAVMSTRDWLASFPRLHAGLRNLWPIRFADARALAWALLICGALGLLALGLRPQHFYSMVWVAPLLALIPLQALAGQPGLLADIKRGDWRRVGLPALAALVAGVFWEMWNYYSLARWEYSIPLVHGFLIFEMPVLGYAGYLPFGIVCVIVGELVCGSRERQGN